MLDLVGSCSYTLGLMGWLATVLVIVTLLYLFSVNVFQVLREVIPKDKNLFVIYQNVQKWKGF